MVSNIQQPPLYSYTWAHIPRNTKHVSKKALKTPCADVPRDTVISCCSSWQRPYFIFSNKPSRFHADPRTQPDIPRFTTHCTGFTVLYVCLFTQFHSAHAVVKSLTTKLHVSYYSIRQYTVLKVCAYWGYAWTTLRLQPGDVLAERLCALWLIHISFYPFSSA